ncbi:MAG: class I SAM-dependent methyltransferase [Planctomycetia bacterium]|nr:class I SAM-dependent methyltransferase [Planctomycetia bacterium]
MGPNVNTEIYWDGRFASGDWEASNGRRQTRLFAAEQAHLLRLPEDFAGSILDFGCGLGDAIPVYKRRFPRATFLGLDHSKTAIELCRQHYGELATFIHGDRDRVPEVDVIVASNILEHLDDDVLTAETLLTKCSDLYIFVPYKENPLHHEHVNSYDKDYFASFEPCEVKVYAARGYSEYGRRRVINIYMKNFVRPFLGKRLVRRHRQIMFHIRGRRNQPAA